MGLKGWWAATQLEQLTQHATGGAVWRPDWLSGSMMALMFTSPLNHEVKSCDVYMPDTFRWSNLIRLKSLWLQMDVRSTRPTLLSIVILMKRPRQSLKLPPVTSPVYKA